MFIFNEWQYKINEIPYILVSKRHKIASRLLIFIVNKCYNCIFILYLERYNNLPLHEFFRWTQWQTPWKVRRLDQLRRQLRRCLIHQRQRSAPLVLYVSCVETLNILIMNYNTSTGFFFTKNNYIRLASSDSDPIDIQAAEDDPSLWKLKRFNKNIIWRRTKCSQSKFLGPLRCIRDVRIDTMMIDRIPLRLKWRFKCYDCWTPRGGVLVWFS